MLRKVNDGFNIKSYLSVGLFYDCTHECIRIQTVIVVPYKWQRMYNVHLSLYACRPASTFCGGGNKMPTTLVHINHYSNFILPSWAKTG